MRAEASTAIQPYSTPVRTNATGFPITLSQIDAYIGSLRDNGRKHGTIQTYHRNLLRFYQDLPEGKRVMRDTLAAWSAILQDKGYTPRTINVALSAANSFLDFLGLQDCRHVKNLKPPSDEVQPELSRSEYLRLRSAARLLGKERAYLLIKVFACTGLVMGELPSLTAEAVRDGQIVVADKGGRQIMRIPSCLRGELLDYIGRMDIRSGPVFVTRSGKHINRTAVAAHIQGLAHNARVQPEKCNARCLHKLYQTTQESIQSSLALLMEQTYERLLDTEQLSVGWSSGTEKR